MAKYFFGLLSVLTNLSATDSDVFSRSGKQIRIFLESGIVL